MNATRIIRESLIIFTRYPEPGKTKTRLIPALGAEKAALLHRQMTEHTLAQVKRLQAQRSVRVEVCFAGGNSNLMMQWLGNDLIYTVQGEGDLGTRMARSLANTFDDGANYAAIVGTDCPGLNAGSIAAAFDQLHRVCDLVLGPAVDGGYYLLGLRRFIPELFVGVNWGSPEVLSQTVAIAKRLNLSVAYLPQLPDVDRPEDLYVWEQRSS
ncbi:TIGR04282 family arsenosugar biosynthesis glycosyltransferase [Scytonema millei]|uniref:Glycosyltransferase n=1 Tax=Scytonema millei VB511283 TaxID=1245923 RepID=A0A9X5E920_9CYAN|nr:TIGR04282 family arsenosugar biosynthesis glycosyltransferase [Scytonema millei]NHC37023.1 glycosyltransferase [Scytonema millei VB511283]